MSAVVFPRYENYKDSGVDWMGEVPASWERVANKHLFKLRKTQVGKHSSEYDLLSLTLGGIIKRDMENPEGKFPAEFDTYQEVRPGDFVFCHFDVEETPRTVGLSRFHGMITGAYTVYELAADANTSFLYYFYLNADTDKKLRGLYKGLRNTIPKDSFGAFKTPLPPLPEQHAIAVFLDKKCAKIDEAVRIKEEQIKLLRERRQILIQQAVTRGLNPDAPMKDSGIDWIGQIPAHWEVKQFKHLLSIPLKYGANEEAKEYVEGDPRYIRITDFGTNGKLKENTKRTLPRKIAGDYLLEKGDILLARSGGTVGKSFLFAEDMEACFAGYLIMARCDREKILNRYMNLFLRAPSFEHWKELIFSRATIQNIGADKYGALLLPVPPISEQHFILRYAENLNTKLDRAISIKQNQITALKEYKTTLINAAVTGKIKITEDML